MTPRSKLPLSINIYLRDGQLFIPRTAKSAQGLTIECNPVHTTNFPIEPSELGTVLARTYEVSGRPTSETGAADLLGPVGRAARCKSYREFAMNARLVHIAFKDDGIEIYRTVLQSRGGFEYAEHPTTLPKDSSFEDCANAVVALFSEQDE